MKCEFNQVYILFPINTFFVCKKCIFLHNSNTALQISVTKTRATFVRYGKNYQKKFLMNIQFFFV